MDNKVWQEFYCNVSGGGCGGFILVKLHLGINHKVTVVCPKCNHRHERYIVDGEIQDNYTYKGGVKNNNEEELIPTMAAYSKVPSTKAFTNRHLTRSAAVIKNRSDLSESWLEKHAMSEDSK
jgi:hypothetical protein